MPLLLKKRDDKGKGREACLQGPYTGWVRRHFSYCGGTVVPPRGVSRKADGQRHSRRDVYEPPNVRGVVSPLWLDKHAAFSERYSRWVCCSTCRGGCGREPVGANGYLIYCLPFRTEIKTKAMVLSIGLTNRQSFEVQIEC